MGSYPFLESKHHILECFAGKEVDKVDNYVEPAQCKTVQKITASKWLRSTLMMKEKKPNPFS